MSAHACGIIGASTDHFYKINLMIMRITNTVHNTHVHQIRKRPHRVVLPHKSRVASSITLVTCQSRLILIDVKTQGRIPI